jgi:hypothetical protein
MLLYRSMAPSEHQAWKLMSDPLDLDELLVHVSDEASFIRFIQALGADFAHERSLEELSPSTLDWAGASEWENGSVDSFLDAAAAWADSSSRSTSNDGAVSNVWQRCAAILLAGKFYE